MVDECRQANENWLNKQREEIESLEKQHKTKEVYDKVKEKEMYTERWRIYHR